jgi:hypothetical protein
MADSRPDEKTNFQETDLTSMSNILGIVSGAFNMMQKPARQIPPPLLLIGKNLRPGMSARNLAGRIISRMESDANIPMGDVFADGDNSEAKKIVVQAEEIINMIQTEAKVDIVINPGAIQITAAGSAGPIPVVVQGANTVFASGSGGVM